MFSNLKSSSAEFFTHFSHAPSDWCCSAFGESFCFCLCPSYFSLWFRIVEQGGICRTHCLMCSPTCVPFPWVSFSIWHCCQPSGILDGALLVSRLQLRRQMAFNSKSDNLDALPSIFFWLLVWCSHNLQKAILAGILSFGNSYGHWSSWEYFLWKKDM